VDVPPNFSIVLTDCSNVNECRSSSAWPDYEAEHIAFGIESLVVHNVPSSTDVVERRRKKNVARPTSSHAAGRCRVSDIHFSRKVLYETAQ